MLVNILVYETTTGTGGIYVKNVDATPDTYKTEFIEYNDTAKTFTAKRNGIFVITVDRASRSIIRVYYNSTSTYSQYTSANILDNPIELNVNKDDYIKIWLGSGTTSTTVNKYCNGNLLFRPT